MRGAAAAERVLPAIQRLIAERLERWRMPAGDAEPVRATATS